ncbi:MAG: hypothetical protein NTU80_09080 [Verrucomicrobia bacterium]|nr:hypothetical protein [Verrucomicrobiota bacterium]
MNRPLSTLLIACSLLTLTACRRDEVRTYTVAKSPEPATATPASSLPAPGSPPPAPVSPAAGASMANTAVTTASGPGLVWTAPAHWQAGPERPMRKATFFVPGEAGAKAELSVTAFPGDVGGNLANVNRWRQQIGLPALGADQLGGALQHLHVGDFHVDVAELVGPGAPPAKRVLGAIVPHAGATWFFKLDGPDTLVAQEKPAFLAFLKTLRPQS